MPDDKLVATMESLRRQAQRKRARIRTTATGWRLDDSATAAAIGEYADLSALADGIAWCDAPAAEDPAQLTGHRLGVW
jgi:hypothetical protein